MKEYILHLSKDSTSMNVIELVSKTPYAIMNIKNPIIIIIDNWVHVYKTKEKQTIDSIKQMTIEKTELKGDLAFSEELSKVTFAN